MKRLYSILLAVFLFLGNITFISAEDVTRTFYLMVRSDFTSEAEPATLYLGTSSSVNSWIASTYEETIVVESDYLGNPIESGKPAILKFTYPAKYTYVDFDSLKDNTSTFQPEDNAVYAKMGEVTKLDIAVDDLDHITLIDGGLLDDGAILEEEQPMVVLGDVPYYVVNKGTLLYAYASHPIINEGTIVNGYFGGFENHGTILNCTLGEWSYIYNYGTIEAGDFSAGNVVLYDCSNGASEQVKAQCECYTPQSVTYNLEHVTFNQEPAMTTPGENIQIDIKAEEGYVLPENIDIKTNGEPVDSYSYAYEATSATEGYLWFGGLATGPIEISLKAEQYEQSSIETLQIGYTYAVSKGYLRQTSGEGWSYDNATNTLTIENLTIVDGELDHAIYCRNDLNLVVKGTNTLDLSLSNLTDDAIYVDGDLIITGTSNDTLIVRGDTYAFEASYLEISGCKLDVKSMSDSAAVALSVDRGAIIKDGAEVVVETISTYGSFSTAVSSYAGGIIVENATLKAIAAGTESDSIAIDVYKELELINANVYTSSKQFDVDANEGIIFDDASVFTINKVRFLTKTLVWDASTRTFVCPGHTGGELTCSGYECEHCQELYGEGDGISHFGGTANCTYQKVCDGCGASYGELDLDNHKWVNGVCGDCSEVCAHVDYEHLGLCQECFVFFGTEVKADSSFAVPNLQYFKFVPKATNTYIVKTVSTGDAYLQIYNVEMNRLASADDNEQMENTRDASLEYTFEAGKTYYIRVRDYDNEYDMKLTIECKEHLATKATCQEASICSACEKELAPTDLNNHGEYLVQVGPQGATYNQVGWDAYEYCTKCTYTTYEEIPMKQLLAVENLSADATDYKTVTLTWDAVAGARAYDVYRKSYDAEEFKLYKSVEDTTLVVTGVMTGKEYAFYVVAKNDAIQAKASETVSVATALEGKVKLEMEQVSASKFKLSWNKIDGATRYIVYRKRNDDKLKKVLTLGADKLEYTTAEMPNGEYQFVLKAGRYDSIDRVMTKASNTVTGSVAKVKPSITLSAGTKQVKVSWKKLEGVTNYEVYRATSGKYTKIKTTTATSYTAKSLTSGKKYYFKVRGYKLYKSGDDIKYNVYTDYSSAKGATAK